ncbi:MAG TPA: hypothetical protein VHC20_01455 [Candidatus Paceibacterota bacterium]|nr:hypothetical protein [Candidatus Paceibacterota bacterium]
MAEEDSPDGCNELELRQRLDENLGALQSVRDTYANAAILQLPRRTQRAVM